MPRSWCSATPTTFSSSSLHPSVNQTSLYRRRSRSRVAAEVRLVHDERCPCLAAELGPEVAGGTGHEPERRPRHMTGRGGPPGGLLDFGGELVEREVVRAAYLQDAAAGCGVGHGLLK